MSKADMQYLIDKYGGEPYYGPPPVLGEVGSDGRIWVRFIPLADPALVVSEPDEPDGHVAECSADKAAQL